MVLCCGSYKVIQVELFQFPISLENRVKYKQSENHLRTNELRDTKARVTVSIA